MRLAFLQLELSPFAPRRSRLRVPQEMGVGLAGAKGLQPHPGVMKTWPCADFSFIRDLLRILSWCKPVFAGIVPILPTSLGTSPRRPYPDIAQAPRRSFQLSASRQS